MPTIVAPLTAAEKAEAAAMLRELGQRHRRIELVPTPRPTHRGHMIRVCTETNPEWYSALAATMTKKRSTRKIRRRRCHDTDLRRYLVEPALVRLSKGICRHPYDWMLRPIVEAEAKKSAANEAR